MEKLELKFNKLEKEVSNLSEFLFALENKNETYWKVLKNTIFHMKEELSSMITHEYFDKIFLNNLNEL